MINTLIETLNDTMMQGKSFQFDPVIYRLKSKLNSSVNNPNLNNPDYLNEA